MVVIPSGPANVGHRGCAVLPYGLAQIEAEQPSPARIERQAVGVRAHVQASEEFLVRTPLDADLRRFAVRGEQQVLARGDENSGHAGGPSERAQERTGLAD